MFHMQTAGYKWPAGKLQGMFWPTGRPQMANAVPTFLKERSPAGSRGKEGAHPSLTVFQYPRAGHSSGPASFH